MLSNAAHLRPRSGGRLPLKLWRAAGADVSALTDIEQCRTPIQERPEHGTND